MERKDLILSPEYITTRIQLDLYNCAEQFMESTGKNRSQLAQHLGVSKGYVTQLLNGDYDHKLSKLVELSLAFGVVPQIRFVPAEDYLMSDEFKVSCAPKHYLPSLRHKDTTPAQSFSSERISPHSQHIA